jgi:hypothetical protein
MFEFPIAIPFRSRVGQFLLAMEESASTAKRQLQASIT